MEINKKSSYVFRPLQLLRVASGRKVHPFARSGHRLVASESNLFVFGGYNPRSTHDMLHRELWAFNISTSTWKLLFNEQTKNMPNELASNALIRHNNVLISYGGTGYPFGEASSNSCFMIPIEPTNGIYRLQSSGEKPIPQYGICIVVHNNYLYTIGGTTGYDYYLDVYRLCLKTLVWEQVYVSRTELREDPAGRYRHEVVYDGKYVYILGGGNSTTIFGFDILATFNLEENCWEYLTTFPDRSLRKVENGNVLVTGYPKPRKCFSCVQHTNSNGEVEAFITGGVQLFTFPYLSDIWRFNAHTKQWTYIRTIVKLPNPLYFHAAALSNSCMYIFGGIDIKNNQIRRRKDLFKIWITIPKLSEICWDALLFYQKNLHKQRRIDLIKAGIPRHFISRLPLTIEEVT